MENMGKELQPTYGNFTLRGQIVWKERKNAYREDTSDNGYAYRSIRFGVKTADKNIVEVELFQTKFEEVSLQNIETKKLDKRVPYGQHTGELPEGYRLFMPIHLGIKQDEDGENVKVKLIPYDAIEYINNNLNNGDTVFMFGSPRFSEYEKDGNKVPQVVFEPRGIFGSSTDFEDDAFTSEAVFDQQIVIRGSEKKEDRLIVDTYIITDKKGNFVPHRFYIDINKYQKFAMNVRKLKFGTLLSVEGLIKHTVTEKEVQVDSGWGESPVKNAIENVKKELEITLAKQPKKEDMAFYSKEDFVVKKVEEKREDNPFKEENNESSSDDDWGSSASSANNDDPFKDDFGY